MTQSIPRVALMIILVMICFGSSVAYGGIVVCPVCGESFDEAEGECPNDGTDLRLLGKDSRKTSSSEPKDNADVSSESGSGVKDSAEPGGDNEPLLYKRHDVDGERKIIETEEPGGYSDRQSRLPKDDRTTSVVKPKRGVDKVQAPSPPVRDDADLLDDFERRRRRSWEERESIRLRNSQIKEHRAAVRRKLLESLGAPLTSLGGRIFWLKQDPDSGPVGAAEIDVNFVRYKIRAGLSTLVGVRALSDQNELLFLESANLGMQWPARFSPFVIAKGGAGVLATNRSGEDDAYLFSAFGAEAGIDAWLHPWLAMAPSFGYMRSMVKGTQWNSFTFKLAVGF